MHTPFCREKPALHLQKALLTTESAFGPQAMHSVEPAGENVPFEHGVQSIAVVVLKPFGHEHSDDEATLRDGARTFFPAGHFWHASIMHNKQVVAPSTSEYDPGPHSKHTPAVSAPVEFEYFPSPQCSQETSVTAPD